ncbi:Insulin-like growth factor binding protein, N-terminal [Pseudocohnilembus persalinus]|uniref:Insulin-like growth factor binding protein, N-terminal n=1 Tax=Pseudocohnilembus persalinus TaxID=266149 RepID=A0A0V0QLN6_PSEPJ|nr:Insulin-like growth factor binding protein, N-terminal [Pseudocohnilembus persalinus]|eukprot:KRX03163.1 Insulin-like growth factor binding protein, N-terminal [Pseudocohnilembus persalinus]
MKQKNHIYTTIILLSIFIIHSQQYTNTETYIRTTEPTCGNNGIYVSGICYECGQNCSLCLIPGACDLCESSDYYANGDHCAYIPSKEQFQAFDDYLLDQTSEEAEGCSAGCRTEGDFICTSCSQGYKLTNGFCTQCNIANCLQCNDGVSTCTSCENGYVLESSSCVSCNDPNCVTCNSSGANDCDQCAIGYRNNGSGACNACITGCANCSNGSTCDVCYDGYYLNGSNTCTQCGANIALCSDANTIIQCDEYYTLLDGNCVNVKGIYSEKDPSSCQVYASEYSCSSCFTGYTLDGSNLCTKVSCDDDEYQTTTGGACISCGANVKTCTYDTNDSSLTIDSCVSNAYLESDKTTCTLCQNNSKFTENQAQIKTCTSSQIITCNSGFSPNNSKTKCIECPQNCESCSIDSDDNVESCSECIDYYIVNPENSLECLQCQNTNNCLKCDSNLVDCTICPNGHFLTDYLYCSNTIENCYEVDQDGCKACRVGYKRSSDKKSCVDCTSDASCQTTCVNDKLYVEQIIRNGAYLLQQQQSYFLLLALLIFILN